MPTTIIGVLAVLDRWNKLIGIEARVNDTPVMLQVNDTDPGYEQLTDARKGDPVTIVVEMEMATVPSPRPNPKLVEVTGIPIDKRGTVDLAMSHAQLAIAAERKLHENILSDAELAAFRLIDRGEPEDDARVAATRVLLGLREPPPRTQGKTIPSVKFYGQSYTL